MRVLTTSTRANIKSRRPEHPYERLLKKYKRIEKEGSRYDQKHVQRIECSLCNSVLTDRGMKNTLMFEKRVTLFTTDLCPTVFPINEEYTLDLCSCRICDTACLDCGNVVGHQIIAPCKECLHQPNNGHFYVFNSSKVKAQIIWMETESSAYLPLVWGLVRQAADFCGWTNDSAYQEGSDIPCSLAINFTRADIVRLHVRKPCMSLVPHFDDPDYFDERMDNIHCSHFHEADSDFLISSSE